MKNILVTGGSGFIGSNFIRFLLTDPDFDGRIINADKLTYAGNPDNLSDLMNMVADSKSRFEDRYIFENADICDADRIKDLFKQYRVDAVCHFAAESHVDRSITGPAAFIQTNIVGTFNLLEAVRSHRDQVTLFHHVSTDEVFGTLDETGYFKEDTPYDPSSPYSASKAASDHLVRAYGRTYALPFTLSNCSNNYGPYQFPEKLIPLMVLNALEGKPLPVYGDGKNVRDWLYVTDHCRAVWTVMQHGTRGETYNIGGRCEKENITVVETICDLVDSLRGRGVEGARGRGGEAGVSCRELITYITDRPGHDRRYAIDCSKIERELGWRPAESFETGLEKTIRWYMENPRWIERVKSGAYRQWMETQYGFERKTA